MTISEILVLLTLVVSIIHVTFEITWTVSNHQGKNDKKKK